MAASMSFSSSPIWNKFQASLSKPLPQRCPELDHLIRNTSTKDLSNILPALLDHIFGFGTEQGWGLDQILRNHNHSDFMAVCRFLRPDGTLLSLVYNLQTDIYLTYEFPFACLPAPTRNMIEEGSLSMFYVNKLQYQGFGKPSLTLGAFELFVFYFCYALVSPTWQMKSLNWNNMTDVVYPSLFDEYLHYFLPLNKKSLPKFPQSTSSPMRNAMLAQSQSQPTASRPPTPGTQTRSRSRLGLLRANVLSPQKQHTQSSPGADKAEGDIWWSETFIQIVAEFWLNQNSLETDRSITPQNLQKSWKSDSMSDSYFTLLESFMPSNNHVRLVRLLFKHIHFFVNSAEPEPVPSPYHTIDTSPLDEFKRSLLPTILEKKIYGFLRHGFDRWPLDSSFRLMLETWLTYIQPWRYTDAQADQKTINKDADTVTDQWLPFIRDNFLFYSAIFHEFLLRTKIMQLNSIHNAYIVFRVSKVFSLTNFPQLMREVEKMMYHAGYKQTHDLGGSYISPEISTVLRIQMSELERPDFHYLNMFGPEMNREIHYLLHQINTARAMVDSQTPVKKPSKTGIAAFFDMSSYFEDNSKNYGDLGQAEVKKLKAHLEQAYANYCILFGLKYELTPPTSPSQPTHSTEPSGHSPGAQTPGPSSHGAGPSHGTGPGPYSPDSHTSLHQSFPGMSDRSMMNSSWSSQQGTPDCQFTQYGPRLTPAGRYQLMNGLKKFDISYQGDPDLQPIRSFENATLVRILHRMAVFLNKLFQNEILQMYSRTDLVGKLSHVYFAAPMSASKVPSLPSQPEVVENLKTPRISLRFLGSYQTMTYLVLLYMMLRFSFGVGPIGYMMTLLLGVLLFGLFRALTLREEVEAD